MSRNIQKKPTKTVVAKKSKKTPAQSRSSPTSSDDDYAELDDISDSEDEEPDVEKAEEQAIIESLANGSEYDEDADDESNDDEGDAPQPEQDGDDNESFNGFSDEPTNDFFNEQLPPTVRRRVHFDLDEVDYSSSSETDSDGDVFPDLLAEEDLDPKFRLLVQNDDNGDEDDGSETFWDWENATANYEHIDAGENALMNMSEDDDSGSSGYSSTDEGETTEEDMPSETKVYVHASRTVLRHDEEDDSSSGEEIVTRTPRLGTWYNDGTQSFAVTDHSSQKLVMFVAKTPQKRRHSYDGSQMSNLVTAESSFTSAEPFSDISQMIIGTPENVMLGASWIDSSNNGFMMSPEALTGSTPYSFNGNIGEGVHGSQSSSTEGDLEDCGAIGDFDFDDFVNRDSDDEDEDDSSVNGIATSPSSLRRPSAATSMGSQEDTYIHPLFSHLNSVGVGAFRRNQNHHRLITRNNESHESLAFSGPIHEGTLRGVKQGKLAAVNTPMTPLRKAKTRADYTPTPTHTLEKRKFGGDQTNGGAVNGHGHKRSRSMA